MTIVSVSHEVESFDDWKPYFDDHDSVREEYGQQSYRLFRGEDNPNDITAQMEWDSRENAERFLEESDVREIMAESGVVGEPEIRFLEEVETRMPSRPSA